MIKKPLSPASQKLLDDFRDSLDEPNPRLDSYDKVEWFDVARKLKPGLTEEEYDRMWSDFQKAKAEHERTKGMQ